MNKSKKNKFKATSKLGYIILTVVTASMGVALLAFGAQSLDALAITIGAITALYLDNYIVVNVCHQITSTSMNDVDAPRGTSPLSSLSAKVM